MKIAIYESQGSGDYKYSGLVEELSDDEPPIRKRFTKKNKGKKQNIPKQTKVNTVKRRDSIKLPERQLAIANQLTLKSIVRNALIENDLVQDGNSIVVPIQYSMRYFLPEEISRTVRLQARRDQKLKSEALSDLEERAGNFKVWGSDEPIHSKIASIAIKGCTQDEVGFRAVAITLRDREQLILNEERRQAVERVGVSSDKSPVYVPLILVKNENDAVRLGDSIRLHPGAVGSGVVFQPVSQTEQLF